MPVVEFEMNQAINEFFVRPQRQTYYSFDLGPNMFFVKGQKCFRKDYTVPNKEKHELMVSFYQIGEEKYENSVIYLHTHHGSKLEATIMV